MRRRILTLMLLLAAFCSKAEVVHVKQQTVAGGRTNVLSTATAETEASYTTRTAPSLSGYIFTHWSMEPATEGAIVNRDGWGRALDFATYRLYEDVTLTANYLPQAEDTDNDGASDGHELYWYGSLDAVSGDSDNDSDGKTFSLEMELGTNPFFAETYSAGGVESLSGGEKIQYNPKNLQYYVIRCEPEGKLFATISNLVSAGTVVTTPGVNAGSSQFAYWAHDGVVQRDAMGRALDSVTFTVPSTATELVAVCEPDATKRQLLYWYGTDEVDSGSDTDGDGVTFAQEMELGTNPLFADAFVSGGVEALPGTGALQYNPRNLQYYIIRSDPEKKLFATISNLVEAGTVVTTPSLSPSSSSFAYWTHDGVRQVDAMGRALDKVTFTVPAQKTELVAVAIDDKARRLSEYWYGHAGVSESDDTDGDGIGFADELELGTSPFFADSFAPGGVLNLSGNTLEVNLQPYEQEEGVVVGGKYVQMFTSVFAGNASVSETLGGGTQVWPVVADFDGDGLFDLVVAWEGGARYFANVGVSGSPEFEETDSVPADAVDLMMNSIEKLSGMSFDVKPEQALSATTNGTTLLVSDAEGRIWYYQGIGDNGLNFKLQHKVWGGTYPGFAEGLMIAAVDWDADGDLDCLCGTAKGKLMLLKDPTVGSPAGLEGVAGVDNALLSWFPSGRSRVRGYRIYRGDARVAESSLPTYRDFPGANGIYDYKVSSVSRFYTAGNSTPSVKESIVSEPVRVTLGTVSLKWNDVQVFSGDEVEVVLAIENSLGVSGDALVTVSYDAEKLTPVEIRTTGLTDGIFVDEEKSALGKWTAKLSGGSVGAGSGSFLVFAFRTASVCETEVALENAVLKAADGVGLSVEMPGPVKVGVVARSEGESDPSIVPPWSLGDMNGDGRLTKEDSQILAQLKQSSKPKWNENELRAGDFNGNDKLDNADYQALRAILKDIGAIGGGK